MAFNLKNMRLQNILGRQQTIPNQNILRVDALFYTHNGVREEFPATLTAIVDGKPLLYKPTVEEVWVMELNPKDFLFETTTDSVQGMKSSDKEKPFEVEPKPVDLSNSKKRKRVEEEPIRVEKEQIPRVLLNIKVEPYPGMDLSNPSKRKVVEKKLIPYSSRYPELFTMLNTQ